MIKHSRIGYLLSWDHARVALLALGILALSRVSASALHEPLPIDQVPPPEVGVYQHLTDAWFDKTDATGNITLPVENWTPGTAYYEWQGVIPHYLSIAGFGGYSYFYEARDEFSQWHYLMNDFTGRDIPLEQAADQDNEFEWNWDGHYYFVRVYSTGATKVWIDTGPSGPEVLGTGIFGAYRFAGSPNMPKAHTIYELQIPYNLAPPIRDEIRFRDLNNFNQWIGTMPDEGGAGWLLFLATALLLGWKLRLSLS